MEIKCKEQISMGNGQTNAHFFQTVACKDMQLSINNLAAVHEVL